MTFTIYTVESPSLRVYEASAGTLEKAWKKCEQLGKTRRHPLVIVPSNPRRCPIPYRIAQKKL
jgi:hypothetical protein